MNKSESTRGSIIPKTLIASAIIGFLTVTGAIFMPKEPTVGTSIYINPNELTIEKDKNFTITIIVESDELVNAFAGVLEFDETILEVANINYNTSIADLWTQEPWFAKGKGTITFAGGTTRAGGFIGNGSLLTVNFTGKSATTTPLKLSSTRVIKHDGLGTDVTLRKSLDAMFTIKSAPEGSPTYSQSNPDAVVPATDLNNDGSTTVVDISIFMLQLASQNLRSDFNNDKRVSATDLSILLDARK